MGAYLSEVEVALCCGLNGESMLDVQSLLSYFKESYLLPYISIRVGEIAGKKIKVVVIR